MDWDECGVHLPGCVGVAAYIPAERQASSHARVWEKGEGGCVAESLVHVLFLPEDVHAFEDGIDESLGWRLQWHTIVVISCFFWFTTNFYVHSLCFYTYYCCFIRPLN